MTIKINLNKNSKKVSLIIDLNNSLRSLNLYAANTIFKANSFIQKILQKNLLSPSHKVLSGINFKFS